MTSMSRVPFATRHAGPFADIGGESVKGWMSPAPQRVLHQFNSAQRSRQALTFGAEVPESSGDHMRQDELAEFAPGGPVSLASALDSAVEDMASDEGQHYRMLSQGGIPAQLRKEVQQPRHGGGFPILAAWRADCDWPASWRAPR